MKDLSTQEQIVSSLEKELEQVEKKLHATYEVKVYIENKINEHLDFILQEQLKQLGRN